jgi:hypothetical protein
VTEPALILEIARDGAVDRQLQGFPPAAVADGEIVVVRLDADEAGHLEPPDAGEVVLSVPSPETLLREADETHRVLDEAGTGTEPLVIVVEAADELRDDELAVVLDAAARSPRSVILRVVADG